MTRVFFIQNMALEYFGVEIISALLKKNNHIPELRILNVDGEKKTLEFIERFKPDLIGFYLMSVDYEWAFRLARKIKKRYNVKVIYGGPLPTFFPDVVINEPSTDYLCRGEGEYAMLELANALQNNKNDTKIKNLWVKKNGKIFKNDLRPLIENLDELPFFDREIYFKRYGFLRNFTSKRFMTDRGCPYNCSYCFNHKLRELYKGKGKYIRIQSPERAIREIEYILKKYGAKFVSFTNDSFTSDHKWMFEFLKLYKERIKIPFTIQCRVNEINEEVARELRIAGCYSAMFGLESGSERIRKEVLNRYMTNEQIINASRLLKKYRIKIVTANMFGMPTETLKEAFETVDLNIKIKADVPASAVFQPIHGTKSYELTIEKGLFRKGYNISKTQTQFGGSNLNQKDIEKVVNLQRLFYYAVKFPFLWPLIKKLINYNLGPIYKLFWSFGYGMKYIQSRKLNFFDAVKQGWLMRQVGKEIK